MWTSPSLASVQNFVQIFQVIGHDASSCGDASGFQSGGSFWTFVQLFESADVEWYFDSVRDLYFQVPWRESQNVLQELVPTDLHELLKCWRPV